MGLHIGAIVQTLENMGSLRGREWTEKSWGTKSVCREVLMFTEQKDELELMAQIQEQRRMYS